MACMIIEVTSYFSAINEGGSGHHEIPFDRLLFLIMTHAEVQ